MWRKNDVNIWKRFAFRTHGSQYNSDILSGLTDMLSRRRVPRNLLDGIKRLNLLKSGPTPGRRGGPRIALHSDGKGMRKADRRTHISRTHITKEANDAEW
jgi:hypothetical protein